jgi:hypothetical protein
MGVSLELVERFGIEPPDREERDGDGDEEQVFHDVLEVK